MRLDTLRLENFRCFKEVEIAFDEQLTVIVAPNGGGKTAILDGVVVALSPFVGRTGTGKGKQFQQKDSRKVLVKADAGGSYVPSPFWEISLDASGRVSDKVVRWTRQKRTPKGNTTTKDSTVLSTYADELIKGLKSKSHALDLALPIVAFYGTSRIWGPNQSKAGKDGNSILPRPFGYQGCLSASSRFDTFSQWFKVANRSLQHARLRAVDYEAGYNQAQHAMLEGIVRNVQDAVQHVLKPYGTCYLDYRVEDFEITITDSDRKTKLELDQQSDGVQAILSMVGDIASRTSILNPQFGNEAAKKTRGIVLIDEIDMHLHPSWQQVVIGALREAFPLIQFVITTHSPQVLSTVPSKCIRILETEGDGLWMATRPDEQTKGVESAYVMTTVMNTNPIPEVDEAKWLEQYRALIEQGEGNSKSAKKLLERLQDHFGKNHPVMLDCARLLRFQEFKRSRKNSGDS